MKTKAFNATLLFYPSKSPKLRLFALWYFTTLMITWNIVGHTVLGFEQSWATPITHFHRNRDFNAPRMD